MEVIEPEAEVELDRYAMYGESAIILLLYMVGILLNGPVLVLYFRSKHIRSITDKFLLNLLMADFASIVLLFPSIMSSFIQTYTTPPQLLLEDDGTLPFPLHTSSFQSQPHLTNTQSLEQIKYEANNSNFSGEQVLLQEEDVLQTAVYWSWSCALSNGIIAGLAAASVLAALEIAMERYLAVVKPLHYHKFLTTPSIVTASLIGGLVSFATAMISTLEPNFSVFPHCLQVQKEIQQFVASANSHNEMFVELDASNEAQTDYNNPANYLFRGLFSFNSTQNGGGTTSYRPSPTRGDLIWSIYSLVNVTFLFVIPVLLMLYIYTRIWVAARRQKYKIAHQYKPYFLPVPKSHVGPDSVKAKVKGAFFHPIVVKFKLMNRFRLTRLDRAGRVAVVALFVTIVCWSPYYYLRASSALQIIMASYGYESHTVGTHGTSWSWNAHVFPLFFAGLHPLLSPLFYAYRYKRLRTEILKQLCELISSPCNPHDNPHANRFAWRSRGFTSSTANTNTSSISGGGGTPCIRQVIITQQLPPKHTINEKSPEFERAPVVIATSKGPTICKEILQHIDENLGVKCVCSCNYVDQPENSVIPNNPHPHICINVYSEDMEEDQSSVKDALETDHPAEEHDPSMSSFVGGIVRVERSVGNFFNYLNVWVNTYSRRWLQHRESVTSTASFITLLSNKYHHNKTHSSVANV